MNSFKTSHLNLFLATGKTFATGVSFPHLLGFSPMSIPPQCLCSQPFLFTPSSLNGTQAGTWWGIHIIVPTGAR